MEKDKFHSLNECGGFLINFPFFDAYIFLFTGLINKISLGDLSSGRAFDNGCTCFDSCQGVVNDLRGQKTDCFCNVSSIFNKRNKINF